MRQSKDRGKTRDVERKSRPFVRNGRYPKRAAQETRRVSKGKKGVDLVGALEGRKRGSPSTPHLFGRMATLVRCYLPCIRFCQSQRVHLPSFFPILPFRRPGSHIRVRWVPSIAPPALSA